MIRRNLFGLAAAGLATWSTGCRRRSRGAVIGFARIDTGGVWRVAETESMRTAAAELARRYELVVTDAQDQTVKQIGDLEDLIARRAKAIFISPREYDGLEPALDAARRAGIPVFLIDRDAEGTTGVDYVTFIGSDFISQGSRAAEWLIRATGGTAGIVELTGTAGSSVARDRAEGFRRGLDGQPGMRIVASQTASFSRSAAQAVLANVLQALGSDVTAVYAHNDEMALGAIQAVSAVGRRAGQDIIIVSVDGQRTALEAIQRGELGATVESNPRFGPLAFDALARHFAGEDVPPRIILPDRLFDAGNAAVFLPDAY